MKRPATQSSHIGSDLIGGDLVRLPFVFESPAIQIGRRWDNEDKVLWTSTSANAIDFGREQSELYTSLLLQDVFLSSRTSSRSLTTLKRYCGKTGSWLDRNSRQPWTVWPVTLMKTDANAIV